MPPWYIRLWCRLLGHDFVGTSAPPVIDLFFLCRRCGKWERLLPKRSRDVTVTNGERR